MRNKNVLIAGAIFGILLATLPTAVSHADVGLGDIWGALDLDAVEWRAIGRCGFLGFGTMVTHYKPVLIIETVQSPGDSCIEGIGQAVSGVLKQALTTILGASVTSTGIGDSATGSKLHFFEAHVYDNPFKDFLAYLYFGRWCYGSDSGGFFKYFSELDAVEWRSGRLERLMHIPEMAQGQIPGSQFIPGLQQTRIGFWGPVYPRIGFIIHPSEPVAAAMAACRAVRIAAEPDGHVVLDPVWFVPVSGDDKIQMVYPKISKAVRIGEHPLFWEIGKESVRGKYIWIYWKRSTCCTF